jgi:hypothetical protein
MYRSYTEQWVDGCGMLKNAILGLLAATSAQVFLALPSKARPTDFDAAAWGRFENLLRNLPK